VFLAVLALIRHRLAPGFPTLPPPVQEAMRRLDDGVAETLESLAERLGRASARPLPDLGERVAALEGLIPLAPSPTAGAPVALAVAERDHAMIARDLVDRVAVLREAVDAAPRGPARSRAS
jgi:hypothetical protein